MDKAIRLLAETSENQKKMNKVLQDLMKIGQMKQELGKQFVPLKKQCCGSGSVCFGPPDPDPLVTNRDPDPDPDPDTSIIKQK